MGQCFGHRNPPCPLHSSRRAFFCLFTANREPPPRASTIPPSSGGSVMGRMLKLSPAPGIEISAYRADPQGTPRGGLVVIQEIFGVNSHIRSCLRRLRGRRLSRRCAGAVRSHRARGRHRLHAADDIARGRELRGKADAELALAGHRRGARRRHGSGQGRRRSATAGAAISRGCRPRAFPDSACAICYYGGGMHEAVGEQPKMSSARRTSAKRTR